MRVGLSQLFRRIKPDVPNFRPLGLAYLAACARRRFPDIDVVYRDNPLDLVELEPDVVGIYSTTCYYADSAPVTRSLKRATRAPILLGGPHISSLWESLPRTVDAGVLGEGETTFEELLAIFVEFGSLSPARLERVPGVAFWRDGRICRTADRQMIDDLDALPLPDRSIFPSDAPPYLISSRGCPFKCRFCSPHSIWKGIRLHSVSRIVQEIQEVLPAASRNPGMADRGRPVLVVLDDLFASQRRRLEQLADRLAEVGLLGKMWFDVTVQAASFDEKMCTLLTRLGVCQVNFGAESGSDPVLKYLKGPRSSVDKNQRLIDLCTEAGISVACSFILGSPGETLDDMARTYEFIHRNRGKIGWLGLAPVLPLPGTEIWAQASARGLVAPDMDWNRVALSIMCQRPERMVYLNEHVPLEKFLGVLRAFGDLQREICSPHLAD